MSDHQTVPIQVEGISWQALTLRPAAFTQMQNLVTQQFGIAPTTNDPGFVMFQFPGGGLLELYAPDHVPPYGYNDGVAIGFRVADIETAAQTLAEAGFELLGSLTRFQLDGKPYAYIHFRGSDGKVYGLNQWG